MGLAQLLYIFCAKIREIPLLTNFFIKNYQILPSCPHFFTVFPTLFSLYATKKHCKQHHYTKKSTARPQSAIQQTTTRYFFFIKEGLLNYDFFSVVDIYTSGDWTIGRLHHFTTAEVIPTPLSCPLCGGEGCDAGGGVVIEVEDEGFDRGR